MKTLITASLLAAGLMFPATANADHHIPTPPNQQDYHLDLGGPSIGFSGTGLPDDYSFSYSDGNGYTFSTTGQPGRISSAQTFGDNSIVQLYGSDYRNNTYCILCSNIRLGQYGTNTRITTTTPFFSTTTTTPGGNFSIPQQP